VVIRANPSLEICTDNLKRIQIFLTIHFHKSTDFKNHLKQICS